MLNDYFISCLTLKSYPVAIPSTATEDHLLAVSCSSEDVARVISSMRSNVAAGPDGISSRMLKNTHPSISPSLAALYNTSFKLGKVPADWKSSRVVPIPKPGDPSLAKNYRPISLLPLVSKIQE